MEMVETVSPGLLRGDSERPSIADSEATLVSDAIGDMGDGDQLKSPLESNWSTRSFGLIQSLCSFMSDPGNTSTSI